MATKNPSTEVWLYPDNQGPVVKILQQALNDYHKKEKTEGYTPLKISGRFDKETYLAVKEFQKNNGLKVDGIVGRKTAAKLRSPKLIAGLQELQDEVEKSVAEAKNDQQ